MSFLPRFFGASVILCAVSGCAGSHSAATPAVPPRVQAAAAGTVVTLTVGATPAPSKKTRRPAWAPANTKSFAVSVNTAAPVVTNVAGPGTYSVNVDAPTGTDLFTANIYDAPNASGNILATGSVSAVIAANAVNAVMLNTAAVVARASLAIADASPPYNVGTIPIPLTLTAVDAAGNTIVNSALANPVVLQSSSAHATFDAPSFTSTAPVNVLYDGVQGGPITITAVSPGPSASPTAFTPSDPVTVFPVSLMSPGPDGITTGPDNNLWVTDEDNGHLLAFTTTGTLVHDYAAPLSCINQFTLAPVHCEPYQIVTGPDGALWFTEDNLGLGRVTTAGAIVEYPGGVPAAGPHGLVVGPDGALWYTEEDVNRIGRMTTAGVYSNFALPGGTIDDNATWLAFGPDGRLWYTAGTAARNAIGALNMSTGVVTEYPVPTANAEPLGLTAGPDGALWFTEHQGNRVGRITVAGVVTEYFLPGFAVEAGPIITGPDGNLWVGEMRGAKILRITPAGSITALDVPLGGEFGALTVGPDGNVWFADDLYGRFGRVRVHCC